MVYNFPVRQRKDTTDTALFNLQKKMKMIKY